MTLESRRKFSGFISWSRSMTSLWNDSADLLEDIKASTKKEKEKHRVEFEKKITDIRNESNRICTNIDRGHWFNVEADPDELSKAKETDEFLMPGDATFDTICANINTILERAEEELATKRKKIVLHLRWEYKSSSKKSHDLSIEGIASVVVSADADKDDYKDILKDEIKRMLTVTNSFTDELLGDYMSEQVVGWEESETDEHIRGAYAEQVVWQHKIVTKQLRVEDFI